MTSKEDWDLLAQARQLLNMNKKNENLEKDNKNVFNRGWNVEFINGNMNGLNNGDVIDPRAYVDAYDIFKNMNPDHQRPRDDPLYRPNIIEKLHNIGLLVKKIYYEIYPMKMGEYPKDLIKGVQSDYEKIRTKRHKEFIKSKSIKSDDKYGMKGLKASVVVAVILYCYFISMNNPIPAPILISYVNKAVTRGIGGIRVDSKDYVQMTYQQFEDYRVNEKKGIYKYIKSLRKDCYRNGRQPYEFVHFISRIRMGLDEQTIKEIQDLAKKVHKEKVFKESVPSGTIALVCILAIMKKKNMPVKLDMFGTIPESRLLRLYKILVDSKLIQGLNNNEQMNPFKTKDSVKKTRGTPKGSKGSKTKHTKASIP